MHASYSLAALAALAPLASAHGHVTKVTVGSTTVNAANPADKYQNPIPASPGWLADNLDDGFVAGSAVGTAAIACHKTPQPGKLYASVAAGGSVKLTWNTWPETHKGPVLNYLAKCPNNDCTTADPSALKFFKISQAGFIRQGTANGGEWEIDAMQKNGFTWDVKIPSDIAAGKYVLRHEILALHAAQDGNGAQFYPACINLDITGGGSANPAGVAATSLYKTTDPGVKVTIYGLTSYVIPGPAVYNGAKRFMSRFFA